MKKLFYILACLVLVFLCQNCNKEELAGKIYGTVTDKATGEPIRSAGVELSPGGLKTVTGSEGQFEFADLTAGNYTLFVTKTGYVDLASGTIAVKSGQTAKGDVQMELLPPALKVVDDNNMEIETLDFGDSEADIARSFNIYNDGAESLEWEITSTAQWIDSISKTAGIVRANAKQPIVILIDRNKLVSGENKTTLQITSSNGSKALSVIVTNHRENIVINMLECTEVTGTTAVFNAEMTNMGNPRYTERGFVYATTPMPTTENTIFKFTTAVTDDAHYSITATDLSSNTVYYVRAYAMNVLGTFYSSNQVTVTVNMSLPAVKTNEVTSINVAQGTCIFNGTILSAGDPVYTEHGFVYSTVPAPTVDDMKKMVTGTGVGAFSANIVGLKEGDIYYVRAYATNEKGTAYGEEIMLDFVAAPAKVVTNEVTNINIGAGSATFEGQVETYGDLACIERGFVYSLVNNPTVDDIKLLVSGAETGIFRKNVTGLEYDKFYYVRAFVTNSKGVVYGNEVPLDFTASMPHVSTIGVTNKNIGEGVASFSGSILSLGDLGYTERGFVYAVVHNPTIDNDKVVASGNGTGEFTAQANQLSEGKIYYIRAFATNSKGTVYGEEISLDFTASMPHVSTIGVTNKNIGEGVASFSGSISSLGDLGYTERGFVYAVVHNPTIDNDKVVASGNGTGEFTAQANQLSEGKIYYVRAFATNSKGTVYGEEISMDFTASMPQVSTIGVTNKNIGEGVASFSGSISSLGDLGYTERGFVYAVVHNPTIDNDKVVASGNGTGEFTAQANQLLEGKIYYIRAFATNSKGTVYGEEISMDFTALMPQIATQEVSGKIIASGVATLNGTIISQGDPAYTSRGFVYSIAHSPTKDNATIVNVSGNDVGAFTANVTNLAMGTVYYVRAFATNSKGTIYGEEVVLDFNAIMPQVSTVSVALLTKTSVRLIGVIVADGDPIYTERGFVYGTIQNPTIDDPSVKKIIAGNTSSKQFEKEVTDELFDLPVTCYTRAYALSKAGVVYGDVIMLQTEYIDYLGLPTFEFGGSLYHVYPDMGAMQWDQAMEACSNLSYGGYDDWYLPSIEELRDMYYKRSDDIGDFNTNPNNSWYWSSTIEEGTGGIKVIDFRSGLGNCHPRDSQNRVRCIRK